MENGPARHDGGFIDTDPDAPGMAGLEIAHVRLCFLQIQWCQVSMCTVDWFSHVGIQQLQELDVGCRPDITVDGAP